MRIGIISVPFERNQGAFLQSYGLIKTLEKMGHKAEIMNYKVKENPEESSLLKKAIRFGPRRLIFALKQRPQFNQAWAELPTSQEWPNDMEFDAYILGSDEIWNYKSPTIGYSPLRFGIGLPKGKVVSYAPSFGPVSHKEKIKGDVSEAINNIKYVSVRDVNSQNIVKNITGLDVPIVLDPALLYDFPIVKNKVNFNNFILVYGHFEEYEIKKIQNYAKRTGQKLVSLSGFYNKWCDFNIAVTPFEFVDYFHASDCIVTSTFHGTIFSILANKPFVNLLGEGYRANKVLSLLNMFDISDRVVDDGADIYNIMVREINYSEVNVTRNKLKEGSYNFLERSLDQIEKNMN
jgi:polysaccharide pyruvyl transferase WcaK-like protein